MGKAGKRKPPSRVRYEQGHPTVSCRVPKDIYDRLEAVKKTAGRSFADILKTGLGILELKAEKDEEMREEVYSEGYNDGYDEARREFKVTYSCSVCSGVITVSTRDEKAAIKTYMEEHGWGHGECHRKRQQGYL